MGNMPIGMDGSDAGDFMVVLVFHGYFEAVHG